ncbi:phosphoenolpyruvate--protein phosphotransferase [Levilactobacillus brevis]|uniref:Phosphoenolpyruvate-protein phosphotransferase n=1 Tax=Levilactobacillus brevis ATCC 14869 = DSM 20054 TaxID=649758 RepID=U2PLK4_LEVBR|nr:phosphoenolpyruvate--protein phosphotransferase [Levilactobacillus brevis]ERK44644.1 phosphoenolpyruvate-protein phosphotransferase [Levilactobacillus brevis ATCC 14869 = DSM 20054]KIO97928.1 Phosphoenolpyruvate-protein phosphotransferase of PTS system [Levilactobacillus brevis]KRK21463.1 phosphoenolpyruvate-protein phosphatase [Levilactobacillus brevis ATCC 14869 = DSM 20054]SQG81235.1 phosphoenolpyruvate-protein phosphotransferase [Levilactobacillus brevis]
MTKTLKGIAASDGIGIAKAYCLVAPDLSFQTKTIADSASEVKRLEQALQAATSDLTQIRDKALANLGQDEAAVFEAHMAILADPDMVGQIKELITTKMINAEAALQTVTDQFITIFDGMTDNPYMQERSADVKDVTKRVLSHLLNRPLPDPALIDEPVIIVAHDLTPSETAQMNRQFVKGFLTDLGGRTSHSAIMSRTLEIPAVVGTENATQEITTGMSLIVDGLDGLTLVTPTATELVQFKHQAQEFAQKRATWQKLRRVPTVSQDGKHVVLAANVGTPDDSNGAVAAGAEAIGLFRTEFLYMNSDQLPSEDAQFAAYKEVVMAMHGKPVVIRTMDIGGDKPLTYLPLPKEMNPFLGYRAIRISLDRQEIFRTQLRALIRAANYGEIRIMFPMIATLDEFRAAKQIFNEEQQRLVASGVSVAKTIQLGMMVEIPASAISADQFAKEVDFFSIGTNDLIQYTFAADRGNEHVSYLYQPYNPTLLRLIQHVITAAHKEGKSVAMCGEMAGDRLAAPLLLGMGLDEFSMSATSILRVRSQMKQLKTTDWAKIANQAIQHCQTNQEVKQLVERHLQA